MPLQIGYAQKLITPSLERPVFLAGFGQNRRAESVHDDLYARALAMADGATTVVVVALDLIGLGRHNCQEVIEQVKASAGEVQLLLAATHTHHGPDTIGLWGADETHSGIDPIYMQHLKRSIAAAVSSALAELQPAALRTASVQVKGVAKNARDPEILDEELTCLQFCRPDSAAPLATWLIFPCHPEVLWDQNPHISSDYLASMRLSVEAETGAPCLAHVGALGGMMTPDMGGNNFDEAERMGQILARAALNSFADVAAEPVDRITHDQLVYQIPMPNPLFQMAIQGGLLPDFVDQAGCISTEAHLLKLNDTWLFTVPGELLPALGLQYKTKLRQAGAVNAAVIGLTNDETGYILPAESFVFPDNPFDPEDHYEETMSIGIEAGPQLTAALTELIRRGQTQ